ncbi:MAG TPA: hypothetical protein VGF67_05020 [Ktedonobacteraceae bacterium]|jgi:hypothetical protein
MHLSGIRTKISPTRLRRISVALMCLGVLLIICDAAYLVLTLSTAPTAARPPRAIPTVSPSSLYTSVTGRKPLLDDILDGKHPGSWGLYRQAQSAYRFQGSALHATMTAGTFPALIECPLRNETFSNLAIQVRFTILAGSQSFVGLFFRADQQQTHMYRFYIDFYGDYAFSTEQRGEPVGTNLAIFQAGLQAHKTLTLTVIALKTSFFLYLDQNYLRTVSDASYSAGEIGLFVSRGNGEATDIAFRQAKVWNL